MLDRRAAGRGVRDPLGQAPRIAVLEDDDALRDDILLPAFAARGFAAEGFARAADLYRRMLSASFDVAVVDIGLPDEDGLSVARNLRAGSQLGIVVLTGTGGPAERIRALDEVADAWLSKPVETGVVVATVGSVLRRVHMPPATAEAEVVRPGWRLAAGQWRLLAPSGRAVELNRAERCVLAFLFAAQGEAVARERLIEELGEPLHDFDPHRLDMLVHRLRRKVAEELGEELPLRAVRGLGYVFFADDAGT
jgi:DNA-binding response OmpR family regulator